MTSNLRLLTDAKKLFFILETLLLSNVDFLSVKLHPHRLLELGHCGHLVQQRLEEAQELLIVGLVELAIVVQNCE